MRVTTTLGQDPVCRVNEGKLLIKGFNY